MLQQKKVRWEFKPKKIRSFPTLDETEKQLAIFFADDDDEEKEVVIDKSKKR